LHRTLEENGWVTYAQKGGGPSARRDKWQPEPQGSFIGREVESCG